MSGLLVSVRNVEEAQAALEGGAGVIDVKEPSHGPLGKADDVVIRAILSTVAGRVPVSAAMGELDRCDPAPVVTGLSFAKWGPLGCEPHQLEEYYLALRAQTSCVVVPCAYADLTHDFPARFEAVCALALRHRFPVLLIDTFDKQRGHLLEARPLTELAHLAARCREAGVKLALAGSLTIDMIEQLRPLRPTWFAVRGAACDGGRSGRVQTHRVRELVKRVQEVAPL